MKLSVLSYPRGCLGATRHGNAACGRLVEGIGGGDLSYVEENVERRVD